MITYTFLQHYWWFLISLVGGLLTLLLFVQGGQSMLFSLARNESERRVIVNVLGRKWEYTFTTLVTFGGALFASFPLFYSTSFGGAYWVWIIILLTFIVQAVSYEFQSKSGNIFGANTYRGLLLANGVIGTFLIGIVVATFFTGSDFTVGKGNITQIASPVISRWGNPFHGLEALFNIRNLCLGLAVLFLARTLALLFFLNRLNDETLEKRSRKMLLYNSIPFIVFFIAFTLWTFLSKGFAVDPTDGTVFMEPYKYFNNLLQMPLIFIFFLLGVVGVLYGIVASLLCMDFRKGIWYSGVGTVVTVCCMLLITGYNHTAFYPSYSDLQSSLTIFNSSSSQFTLRVMSVVSFLIPVVLAYIVYAWRSLEKKRTDIADINDNEHSY